MPRKELQRDFQACRKIHLFKIHDLRTKHETGPFTLTYLSNSLEAGLVNIQILVPECFDYPTNHEYILYIEDDESAPASLTSALESLQPMIKGKTFQLMLEAVVKALDNSFSPGHEENPIILDKDEVTTASTIIRSKFSPSSNGNDTEDDHDEMDEYDDSAFDYGPSTSLGIVENSAGGTFEASKSKQRRLRSDLRAAKAAGFKVGILGDLTSGGILCISIRVVKLGISEEAMQTWGLLRCHYLVLLIHFGGHYRTLEQVSKPGRLEGKVNMKVALSKTYKPNITDALQAFSMSDVQKAALYPAPIESSKGLTESKAEEFTASESTMTLESLFIGNSLNSLFQHNFASVLRYRLEYGLGWRGAEFFVRDLQAMPRSSVETIDPKYFVPEDPVKTKTLPVIVKADTIAQKKANTTLSLPLVAMQFLLRHFVRCTEFCLNCHCMVDNTFEALKPYVCSKPLCLHQCLFYGFGPSMEWEISSQPYVVDLLVSFCYSSAKLGRLNDLPLGLGLKVPSLAANGTQVKYYSLIPPPANTPGSIAATYDQAKQEILLRTPGCTLKNGDWVVLVSRTDSSNTHCRVNETACFPTIKMGPGIIIARNGSGPGIHTFPSAPPPRSLTPLTPVQIPRSADATATSVSFEVDCFLYDQAFDSLTPQQQQLSIVMLLDTLPQIDELNDDIGFRTRGQDIRLKSNRISDSALLLLRWIIASNRSCLLQVDHTLQHLVSKPSGSEISPSPLGGPTNCVSGMKDWIQFRFAQGAPDKEQRFIDCVNKESGAKPYPTLFAWHGSPVENWHSIVREGLNHNQTLHGRAYGNGVYMSPHCVTSIQYSGGRGMISGSFCWPNSVLKVYAVLSLNEVVNVPERFVSRHPHYVVDQIDWIQTRYLFVKSTAKVDNDDFSTGGPFYRQDPKVTATDDLNKAISIPITAISRSRRPAVSSEVHRKKISGPKKSKRFATTDQQTADRAEDETNSILTDVGDRLILESDSDEDEGFIDRPEGSSFPSSRNASGTKRARDGSAILFENIQRDGHSRIKTNDSIISSAGKTDFVPGSLDISKLKILHQPSDASVTTTKRLMQDLREALQVQKKTPIHQLGWYIDGDKVSNLYQWIVELHSFEKALPLAQDMKKAGLTSVVLEFRFTNSYPFSPPFVRVLKPRFLPVISGGGGHVTAGGAICMELLTNTGWLGTTTIESMLLQVRLAICTGNRPARLERCGSYGGLGGGEYGVGEAIAAYKRACMVHGWKIPDDFDSLQKE